MNIGTRGKYIQGVEEYDNCTYNNLKKEILL